VSKLKTQMFIALLVLLVFCADSSLFGQSWTAPMVDESTHDFEDVFAGQTSKYRFRITNTTEVALALTPAVSAGPFLVSLSAESIEPGESAELICWLATTIGFQGMHRATATVRFSGGRIGERQFLLKANFVPQVVTSSPAVCFSDFDTGKDNLTTLLVSVSKNSGLKLADVTSNSKHIRAKVLEVGEADKFIVYKMQFKLPGNAAEADREGKMNLMFRCGHSSLTRELEFYSPQSPSLRHAQ